MAQPDNRTDEQKAIGRIGLTADAQHLLARLQRVVDEVAPAHSESGALQELNGKRSFALELIEALETYDAGTANPDGHASRTDRGEPRHVRARGARRRVFGTSEPAGEPSGTS